MALLVEMQPFKYGLSGDLKQDSDFPSSYATGHE